MSENKLDRPDATLHPDWLTKEIKRASFTLEFSTFCKNLTAEEMQDIMRFIKERRAAMANQI